MLSDPGRRLTFAFAESQIHLTSTFVVAILLQTRAPTGKSFGPDKGLLLSRPTTFQVIGVTVSVAWAETGTNRPKTAAPRIPILSPLTTSPLKQSLNAQNSNMCATDCTARNSAEYHDQVASRVGR